MPGARVSRRGGGQYDLHLGERTVPLTVRRNRRARNILLRVDPERDGALITLPSRAALAEGLDLARRKAEWLLGRIDALPARVPFVDGAMVPLLGVGRRICHRPGGRRGTWLADGEIHVSGRPEHLARRLEDWLRARARVEILSRVAEAGQRLGKSPGRVTLRDTRSRWGSCSQAGNLSFCWRLVMAPPPVLDYVVAHEVVHLAHANHGPAFWRQVGDLAGDFESARAWLRENGARLHRYGTGGNLGASIG